jgi:prepilin signal peptidase PulO-like enzyme (type II secretory pathway)
MTEIRGIHAPDDLLEGPAETSSEARLSLRELLPRRLDGAAASATGIALSALSLAEFGASGRALVGVVLCPTLVLLAAVDARHRLLPNELVLWPALLVALIVAATNPSGFLTHLEAGVALAGSLLVLALAVRGGLGMGDVKLGLLLGLSLGSRTLSAMTVALLGLFLAALWIVATQGLAARKQSIAFGPFLALGGILAFFLG